MQANGKINCQISVAVSGPNRKLTSTATPGMNITTASAWKNLRRAFKPRVGTCLSAASNKSVATFDTFAVPFVRFGRFGKFEKVIERDDGVVGAVLSWSATVEGVSSVPDKFGFSPAPFRGRYLRDRANCLFQPATLRQPNRAQ